MLHQLRILNCAMKLFVFPEQHFSETNLTAKISSLSFIISFDEKEDLQGQTTYESSSTSLIPPLHCLEVDCQEIDLSFQVLSTSPSLFLSLVEIVSLWITFYI